MIVLPCCGILLSTHKQNKISDLKFENRLNSNYNEWIQTLRPLQTVILDIFNFCVISDYYNNTDISLNKF